jgi:hypothetical protein
MKETTGAAEEEISMYKKTENSEEVDSESRSPSNARSTSFLNRNKSV